MIIVIRKGFSREKIRSALKKYTSKTRGTDLKKYLGSIHLLEDPVVIQRKLRDEWE